MIAAVHGPSALWYADSRYRRDHAGAADRERRARHRRDRVPGGPPGPRCSRSLPSTGRCRCWRSRCSPSTWPRPRSTRSPDRGAQRGRPVHRPPIGRCGSGSARSPPTCCSPSSVTSLVAPPARLRRVARGALARLRCAGRWRCVHGLGTGSDTQSTWMLALTLGCVSARAGRAGRAARRGCHAATGCAPVASAATAAALVAAIDLGCRKARSHTAGHAAPGRPPESLAAFAVRDARRQPATGPVGGKRRRLRSGILSRPARQRDARTEPRRHRRSPTCACGSTAARRACCASGWAADRWPAGRCAWTRSAVTFGPPTRPRRAISGRVQLASRHRAPGIGRQRGGPRAVRSRSSSRSTGTPSAARMRGVPVGAARQ